MIGKKPVMKAPAVGSPDEEARDVALHRGPTARGRVLAEEEPGERVEDVVQAERDEEAVEGAVEEPADDLVLGDPLTDARQACVERRVDQREEHREDQRREPGDDRHEAPTAEEGEVGRQRDAVVALPQVGGDEAAEDAAEHAVVDELLVLPFGRRGQHERRDGVAHALEDEVADDGGQGRRPVGLLRHADGDADGEEQPQVGEQRVAAAGEDGGDPVPAQAVGAEQVGLAQAQHERRDGQRCDGQHEAAARTSGSVRG